MNRVAILLCTFQAENFLADQLDSFAAQTHSSWALFASDDGSTDKTLTILQNYQEKWGDQKLLISNGPRKGFAANFLSLTCNNTIQADYYAYSDHDDIWEPDKLQRAISWLQTIPPEIPALYCSRLRLVSADQKMLGLSPLFNKPPSFSNALVQAMGSGNTIVFNNTARQHLLTGGADVPAITHDWWAYLVVTACGGKVFYDPYPSIRYRQHGGNIVGMDLSLRTRLLRARRLCQGVLRNWVDRNLLSLKRLDTHITAENKQILNTFCMARNQKLVPRLLGFWRSGIYRQSCLDNFCLFFAALLKRI